MSDGTTRRSLLAAGLGAVAAAIAGALGRPAATSATNGDILHAGTITDAVSSTGLINDTDDHDVFVAVSNDRGPNTGGGAGFSGKSSRGNGVEGASATGAGVYGSSSKGPGVSGISTTGRGVLGASFENYGVVGHSDADRRAGVLGEASQLTSSGVVGVHIGRETSGTLGGEVYGVLGVVPNTPGRVAVGAFALEAAIALRVDGKATFSRSGKALVARGRSSVDVLAPGGLDEASLVLAVPMASRAGVFVQAVVPNASTGTFRIILNKVASVASSTPVAWFIVN
jgi:hypothetical protein